MPIAVGSKAPDFTLKAKTSEGLKDIKLSDNFGKKQTVLLFFPLARCNFLHWLLDSDFPTFVKYHRWV